VIKALVKSKKLRPTRTVSQKFRGVFPLGNIVKSRDLPYIEAAVASGIITESELKYFQPSELATRREFLTWIYNYFDHGTRQTKLEVDQIFQRNQRSFRYNSGLKSRFSIDRRNSQLRKIHQKQKNLKKNLKIKVNSLQEIKIPRKNEISNPFPGKDILDEVYNEIIQNYRFAEDLDAEQKQEMEDRALSALVQALGDKYSNYIRPQKSKQYLDHLKGEFEGIGAYVEMIDEQFTIIAPIGGSPAEKAGLQAQDIVTKVGEREIVGMSINEIVDLIMGPAGTSVDLEISRDSRKLNFTIIRDRISEPAVVLKWKKSVPIIEIHQFNPDTINLLNNILPEILAKKPRGMVLDLRNNPGGYLTSAVDVGSLFLKKGDIIFYTEDRVKTKPYSAKNNGVLSDFENIVVLQNRGTASASEILIGALQDYKKVKIIGETSLGKGTAQDVRNLKNGGLLKLTIAKWLTPKKHWIHEIGIIPDLEITNPTNEERKNKIDKQLDVAVNSILQR
jgi:carboxyl-terminal processing protease